VFLNLLRALGKAGSHPENIEIILRRGGALDHAFHLPKYVDVLVQPALSHLSVLFLDLNTSLPSILVDTGTGASSPCPNYHLMNFLSRVPQLKHLRLNFHTYKDQESNDVLAWLSKSPSNVPDFTPRYPLLECPRPIDFSSLEVLEIGLITVEPEILLAIIRKHRNTLRGISFHKLSLIYSVPADSEGVINAWAKFFASISDLDLNLSTINLSHLTQEQPELECQRSIAFKGSQYPLVKKWAGTDTQSGLRDLRDMVEVVPDDGDSDGSYRYNNGTEYCKLIEI